MSTSELFATAVLNTVSPDQIGTLSFISRYLAERQVSIHSSVTGRLHDDLKDPPVFLYSTSFLFSGMQARISDMENHYKSDLSRFAPALWRVSDLQPHPPTSRPCNCCLTVSCCDRAGVFAELSEFLVSHGVRVVACKSRIARNKDTGVPHFESVMEIEVPVGLPFEEFQSAMDVYAAEFGVSAALRRCSGNANETIPPWLHASKRGITLD